jgi:hypothetical protein
MGGEVDEELGLNRMAVWAGVSKVCELNLKTAVDFNARRKVTQRNSEGSVKIGNTKSQFF